MPGSLQRTIFALFLLVASAADAQSFGQPLAADQVACEERQLERLVHRMVVDSDTSNLLLWRSAAAGGAYRGLSSTSELQYDDQGGRMRKERQLAFDLLFKASEAVLDPRRPRLPQATLVRRDAASNLKPRPATPEQNLAMSFDVAPEVPIDPTRPRQPLVISNYLSPGEEAADRPSRGIAINDFLTPCHSEVSEFDLEVYEILSRTVRVSQCLGQLSCLGGLEKFKSIIFRGAEPLSYRLNVFDYSVACFDDGHCEYGEARTAFLFHLQVDQTGRLTGGDVEALPWCTAPGQLSCTTSVEQEFAFFVLPPIIPGVGLQDESVFRRAAYLNLDFQGSPDNILQSTVNWQDLLQGTAWSTPLPLKTAVGRFSRLRLACLDGCPAPPENAARSRDSAANPLNLH